MASKILSNEIIVGTNEEFILGYHITFDHNDQLSSELSFTSHAHNGRVKQLAVYNQFLASGGTDEFIRIFNLTTRKEIGYMLDHDGSISCLKFHNSGFLFSGAEDGKINIYKKGDWELVKELRVGSHGVNGFCVHPSGKLALSVSKDRKLTTWDMTKGKKVYMASLKKAGDFVEWSPDGLHYAIASINILDIYDVETAEIVHSIDFKDPIYSICFLNNDLFIVGGEKRSLSLFSLIKKEEIVSWAAHETRVKCINILQSNSENRILVASGSSDGYIRIWSIQVENFQEKPKMLGEINTDCRIICMTVYSKFESSSIVSDLANETTKRKRRRKRKKNLTNNSSLHEPSTIINEINKQSEFLKLLESKPNSKISVVKNSKTKLKDHKKQKPKNIKKEMVHKKTITKNKSKLKKNS